MAGEPTIIITNGRLGKDPEFKVTSNGTGICNMSVAVTARKKDGDNWVDAGTTWYRVTQFGKEAEATTEALRKGDKVVVVGKFSISEYEKDGVKIQVPEINAEVVAPVVKPLDIKRTSREETPF